MERIITIDGERSKTTQAARAMLIKLRASYDRDVDHIMVSTESQMFFKFVFTRLLRRIIGSFSFSPHLTRASILMCNEWFYKVNYEQQICLPCLY